jgi:recombination protein RecR
MNYGSEILNRTVDELMKLPGIGRKTAQRLAFYLLKSSPDDAEALAHAIIELKQKVRFCKQCFNASEQELCNLCRDAGRDDSIFCVVEGSTTFWLWKRQPTLRAGTTCCRGTCRRWTGSARTT